MKRWQDIIDRLKEEGDWEAAAALWDARDSIDKLLAAIRSAEQDAAITPEIAAALTGERNRPLVRPKTLPRR